jgi:hypothetical protein
MTRASTGAIVDLKECLMNIEEDVPKSDQEEICWSEPILFEALSLAICGVSKRSEGTPEINVPVCPLWSKSKSTSDRAMTQKQSPARNRKDQCTVPLRLVGAAGAVPEY